MRMVNGEYEKRAPLADEKCANKQQQFFRLHSIIHNNHITTYKTFFNLLKIQNQL